MHRNNQWAASLVLAVVGAGFYAAPSYALSIVPVTHGVATGEIGADSALIWSRTDRKAVMHVRIIGKRGGGNQHRQVGVTSERDFTGKIRVDGLEPDTPYRYKVWFDDDKNKKQFRSEKMEGIFRTAPTPVTSKAVTFAWGGDVAGQNVCRDAQEGFPIFAAINRMKLDFFIGLGDMIYADNTCSAIGRYGNTQVPGDFQQAATLQDFWAHWKYNREETHYQTLLRNTPYYSIWDDHEVVNDFGPLHDTRNNPPYTPDTHLLPLGLQAFLDYNPVEENASTPKRLYRNVRWGKHVEMFILDTRQYRDANSAKDSAQQPKTMLGREQLVWFKEKLKASAATWKFVVSSVPMSIPTGFPAELGRDGWANHKQDTGFEQELMDILQFMRSENMRNVVWLTTDVHFAEVFRYTPFAEHPSFRIHEVVTGPLNAGLFPNRIFDTTLGAEQLFFYGPEAPVVSYAEAKPWMNFGLARINAKGELILSINNVLGEPVYTLTLPP